MCNTAGKGQQRTALCGPDSHSPGTHLAAKLEFLPAAGDLYKQRKYFFWMICHLLKLGEERGGVLNPMKDILRGF